MDAKVSTKTKTFQNLNKNCPSVKFIENPTLGISSFESRKDIKVNLQARNEEDNKQMWERGKKNDQGYFTLTNAQRWDLRDFHT